MPFETVLSGAGEEAVAVLKDKSNNTFVEVLAFGCLLNKFNVHLPGGELNVIDGFRDVAEAKTTISQAFKSAKLSPFTCRLHHATFKFGQETYGITKSFNGINAIHGLLFDAIFSITNYLATDDTAMVTLEHLYDNKQEGFPFRYSCAVTYILSAGNALDIKTTVTNLGDQLMPIADGWHPYFTLGDSIDDYQVEFQSKEMLEFDENLIPTGRLIAYHDFNAIKNFGSTGFDNCFTLNFDTCQPMCVVRNPTKKVQLGLYPEPSYPYLQIYTPDNRQSIAIENLSAAPDAFNNGLGLKVLAPSEEATFTVKYVISLLQ